MTAKSIAITGASSGIGAALAKRLAAPDRSLLLLGRDEARLASVAAACQLAGATVVAASADIRDRQRVEALLTGFDRDHPVDLFVANAGVLDGRHEHDVMEGRDTARLVLETNLMAAIDAAHALLPAMRVRKSGQIVFISSLAGLTPLADAPAYSASKAGLLSYGLALRDVVSTDGIGVHVACPGFIATAMAEIHIGPRPGEISADQAAVRILAGIGQGRALIGFPTLPFWFSLLCLLLPESIRRQGMKGTRFYTKPRHLPWSVQ
jgi:short-subunit dehydrogenase